MLSKTLCISQAFLCLIVTFHKALHLGDNICSRFKAVSINISYKTYKSTKSPIVLPNHLANVQKNQMSLSNGIMRLITRIFCENSLYQKRFCPQESIVGITRSLRMTKIPFGFRSNLFMHGFVFPESRFIFTETLDCLKNLCL